MTGTAPEANEHTDDAPRGIMPRGAVISRRRLLGSGIAASLLVAGGGAGAAHAGAQPAEPHHTRHGYDFLDAAMDAYLDKGPVRLVQSYADQAGLFSAAFTYDNALTILAYLADGRASARARAIALGDALLFAQGNDPEHQDGRLRQGYNVGPYVFYDGAAQPDGFVRADGKANMCYQFGFTGTAVGDMAWAGIALVALARRTNAGRFRRGAIRIADWIEANARTNEPLGGYKFGVDGRNGKLPFTATEHNIDLVALFGQLAALTGKKVYRQRQAIAKAFVEKMWHPDGGFFHTGTNDGVTINTALIPEDAQSWAYLALAGPRYARALDWETTALVVSDDSSRVNSTVPAGQSYAGVTFSSASKLADESAPIAEYQPRPDRNGVWFEGTAHLALAYRQRAAAGDERRARALMDSLVRAQELLGGGQSVGGKALPARSGVVAASSPLDTGYGFGYYPYKHIGATAWYLMAARRTNPLAV